MCPLGSATFPKRSKHFPAVLIPDTPLQASGVSSFKT